VTLWAISQSHNFHLDLNEDAMANMVRELCHGYRYLIGYSSNISIYISCSAAFIAHEKLLFEKLKCLPSEIIKNMLCCVYFIFLLLMHNSAAMCIPFVSCKAGGSVFFKQM
jgi:hypothetical protein